MLLNYDDFLIKRFEQPDEVRTFEKGKFDMAKQNRPWINTDETQMKKDGV
jgi:hypothetical protein